MAHPDPQPTQSSARSALVVGAHGLVGSNLIDHFHTRTGWRVAATGRRAWRPPQGLEYFQADLADGPMLHATWASLSHVTDVFFAAYEMGPTPEAEEAGNLAILANTLDALEHVGAHVRRVVVYHGGKAYGAHLGPFPTPALEDTPRSLDRLFYYAQEDLLRDRAQHTDLGFTILRPDLIFGIGFGRFLNLLHMLSMYALISREAGIPLRFPGPISAYEALIQATDVRLLARASEWAVSDERARNEVFNVTNGDLFRWSQIWPVLATYFGMEIAAPMNIDLKHSMRNKAAIWQAIVRRHDLRPIEYDDYVNWTAADNVFALDWELHSSTIKIRKAGFQDCIDTRASFRELLADMSARRLIPPGSSDACPVAPSSSTPPADQ